ncbi:hypothetical protein FG379_001886 [Cryptosporidium bovis]|uniref:uncharacterized protein n=1 Tax=Cryptosporidium bovis TaxID=310047 RepID=UPI00351A48F6|nr:hypothetical protein FG379_001886 [Cryptosporidium bovis]
MPRKGSNVPGMGTELLNILGLGKYKNNGDDSDTGDNKSSKSSKSTKSHAKFKKLKKLSKENKRSKENKSDSIVNNIEIEIGLNNDNFETVQACEKSAVSSLMDVQSNFERQLEDFCISMKNIKENVDGTETQLEKLYISLDKLEKFVELCSVENADVIKGLHKLMDVYKGAALLSTFSEDPTFKKNYEYNVHEESNSEIIERKLQNMRIVKSMNNDNCEIPNEDNNKKDDENKNIENEKVDKVSSHSSDSIIINNLYNNNENSHNKSTEPNQKSSSPNNASSNNSPINNNKDGKMSKTERFKEKLDNLRIRKGRRKHSKDKYTDSQKDVNNELSNNDLNQLYTDN